MCIRDRSRYLSKPDYFPDPSFRVSDEMREKYGANISQESMQRIVDSDPVNFTEFLDEVRDVETTQKNRARIFEGGALGVAEGALATLLVSGGEAVAATMAATAGAAAISGPLGGAVAGVGTAAAKFRRIKGFWRMATSSLLIDVPLETIRKNLDKSLTETDYYIALASSAFLGGSIGAAFPGLTEFRRVVNTKANVAAAREAADACLLYTSDAADDS